MQASPYPPSPPPPQPMPVSGQEPIEPIRPSGWWFGVAALVAVFGVAAGILVGFRAFDDWNDRIDDLPRVDVGRSGTVTLDEPAEYTVYYEVAPTERPPFLNDGDLVVTVIAPDGSQVPLGTYDRYVGYKSDEHHGYAEFSFTAQEAGEYQVAVETTVPDLVEGNVAIGPGRGLDRPAARYGVAALATGAGGLLIGVVLAIGVGVARSRARWRRYVASSRGSSAWPAPAPGAPPPASTSAPPAPPPPVPAQGSAGGWPQPSPPPPPSASPPPPPPLS